MKQTLTAVGLALLLSGCSTMANWTNSFIGGSDNSEPPAELIEIADPIPFKKLWSKSVGVGYDKQFVNLVPYVYNGQLFVADRKGRVMALDAETGKENWEVKTDTAISGGPGGWQWRGTCGYQ